MRPFPFAAAALTAFAVTACAAQPTAEPDTLTGSDASSATPGFTAYASPQGFSVSLPASARIGGNETAPVKAFEDPAKDRVFIATETYDDPTTPTVDRIATTVDVLRGPHASWVPHWTMDVTEMENDEALDRWVKEHYGPGCAVEERAPTTQPGVDDVLLAGDGLPPETSRCVLNYVYEIRYQPSKKRVLSWELGQGPRFAAGTDTDETYDLAMRDSVRMSD